jgi:hypothetical protein
MPAKLLILLFLLAVVSCDDTQTGITPNPRAYRSYDTLTIWNYKAPPPGQTPHRDLIFPSINDSIVWSSAQDEFFWIYLLYGNYEKLDRWRFAFTPETDFKKLNAPEWYTFYGASNYSQATYPTPGHWNSGSVFFNVHDSPIILVRRVDEPYPVFALRAHSLMVRPEGTFPNDYYQEYGIVALSYY